MNSLLFLFGSAFVIALSGALTPGPVLTTVISETLKRGFWAGPVMVAGHATLEFLLLLGVVAGLGSWITQPAVMRLLGLVGGVLLLGMGTHMIASSGRVARAGLEPTTDIRAAVRGPFLAGIVMSLSNPYWTIWWATIGLNLASLALQQGAAGLISFYSGHILADLVWYSLVSGAVASGRRICSPRVYQGVLIACGVMLLGLGSYFGLSVGLRVFGGST